MWFKNIENWSQKKLKLTWLVYNIIYLILMLVAPIIIVATKYNLSKENSTKLTMVGFILIIFISVFVFRYGKRLLSKLPQAKKSDQVFKFMLLLVVALMMPILGLILIHLIRQNVEQACNTISYCLYSIIAGITLDHLSIKFIETEFDLRSLATIDIEKEKRKATLTQKKGD